MAHKKHEKLIKKTKAPHLPHSHAQKKKSHKSHAHTDSVPACTSLGCKTGSLADPPADPWPKDYPVASFGTDHDVSSTAKNTADAEAKLGAWNPKKDEDGKYVVPTESNEYRYVTAQTHHGHKKHMVKNAEWNVPTAHLTGTTADVRMGAKSDPICSSAGCTQYKHPHKESHDKDYFVPNFGGDSDINRSNESAKTAEAELGHTWTPKFDEEEDEWVVPTESAEFKLAGTETDVRMGHKHRKAARHHHSGAAKKPSDPSCSSSGWCGESLWPAQRAKEDEHAVLRLDTQRGANQSPTEQEKKATHAYKVAKTPDPHPATEEPELDAAPAV